LDLLAIVQNMIAEFPPEIVNKLVSLLEPDEFTRLELERPSLGIRAAAATLERLESEKRCRHLLDSWQLQSIQSIERCMILLLAEDFAEDLDPSDRIEQLYEELNQEALHFQKLFYDERQYLQNLDRQRCTSQEDLVLLE
jgi:DNA primase